jgi:deoxycytidine triphosphate deaminase
MGILSIKGKHTTCNEAFELNKKSDASLIYSDASMVEEFSIELSVGDQWAKDLSKEKAVMYAIEDVITIKPQSSVVLEVKENIHVPFNMYGIILQTGSVFLEQGVLIGAGKIEPSFNGKLRLLVYNTSKTKRTLQKGQKIASAIFMRTDKTINASIYNNNRVPVPKKRGKLAKMYSFFTDDKKFTITLIASVLSSSLIAAFVASYLASDDGRTGSLESSLPDVKSELKQSQLKFIDESQVKTKPLNEKNEKSKK